LQTDVEFAIEKIRETERDYDDDEVDEILIDALPAMISDMEEDISRAKENMR
jgi:hypothetical protein